MKSRARPARTRPEPIRAEIVAGSIAAAARWRSSRRGLHGGRQGGERSGPGASAVNARGAGCRRRGRRARSAIPRHPSLHGLCLRRRQASALRRDRSRRGRSVSMAAQAGRRKGRCSRDGQPCDLAHRLGLQPVRQEFREDHASLGRRSRRGRRRGRPVRQSDAARSISPMAIFAVADNS